MNLANKLGLGTVQFGIPYGISNTNGQTTAAEVESILSFAFEQGIDLVDTAPAYGNAEEVLGRYRVSGFKLVSKYIYPAEQGTIKDQLEKTLHDLRIDSLYGYLAHRPLALINDPQQWQELKQLKEKGLVQKIGYSLNAPGELDALLEKEMIPDLVQVPYNYFDQRFREQLILLKSKGCEIHTRSAFLQGLFFVNPAKLAPYFDEIKPALRLLQSSTEFLSEMLLRFVIDQPF
ncbi:MAG: aldo/keto reductase, partial [Bacteroidetes bacterium]|nr:aldo/keto reductase [Bacteroidota bacterium]